MSFVSFTGGLSPVLDRALGPGSRACAGAGAEPAARTQPHGRNRWGRGRQRRCSEGEGLATVSTLSSSPELNRDSSTRGICAVRISVVCGQVPEPGPAAAPELPHGKAAGYYQSPTSATGAPVVAVASPTVLVACIAVFAAEMFVNDCPRHGSALGGGHSGARSRCVAAGLLRRFSFQLLRENLLWS